MEGARHVILSRRAATRRDTAHSGPGGGGVDRQAARHTRERVSVRVVRYWSPDRWLILVNARVLCASVFCGGVLRSAWPVRLDSHVRVLVDAVCAASRCCVTYDVRNLTQ
ncbi:hypothetical protein CBL_13657 [Carabus blaptoides fortunei]